MIEIVNIFISGMTQLFSGSAFGLMLLGIVIGFFVGILPGLGGPTSLALMLPFIAKMSPVEAFAFLLGMAAVTNTTGDITSILFGIPGEGTTAATIVDGHPMAKKGETGRALGAALLSSLIGAAFGAFSLALAIPIVRPLVLFFSSPELFVVSLLGLTFVISLSGENMLKGFIAGGIGLLLSTVGLAQMSGFPRYVFGQEFLWDGIGLVPITLGLYAIPELVDLGVQRTSIAKEQAGQLGGVMEGVKDTFRHWWLVIRCSAIGTFTAIIPGLGAATTQWLAYAHAVASSPGKERFGKGAVEGVLGPGAANNSSLGGSLITTVAFGIPSSVMTALLLGGFVIQGLVPGPEMLMPEAKGGHLALTFSFVWINVFSNIITVAVCFLFLNQLVKITQIRGSLLVPFILLLIYLGAFAERNAFEDLSLVMGFGLLGWLMQRLNWPRPPIILGLVLGPLSENRLFLSIGSYQGFSWLLRPGVLILLLLTIAGALYPTLRARWRRVKIGTDVSSVTEAVSQDRTNAWKFCWEMVFSFFMVFIFIFALWESRHFNLRAGLYPWAIGFPCLVFSIVQFIQDVAGKKDKNIEPILEGSPELTSEVVNRRTAIIFAWIMGYFVSIWLLGFSIGVPLCTLIQLKIEYREKWPLSLILTAFAWFFTYVLFDRILHVPLFKGNLFLWLKFVTV